MAPVPPAPDPSVAGARHPVVGRGGFRRDPGAFRLGLGEDLHLFRLGLGRPDDLGDELLLADDGLVLRQFRLGGDDRALRFGLRLVDLGPTAQRRGPFRRRN